MRQALAWIVDVLVARRGRAASILGLAFALALLALKPGGVADLRPAWFDVMNRIWAREAKTEAVVIVAIDDASIADVGAWPWPRAKTAELFQRIAAGGPAAVGVDMLFSELDDAAPAALAERPDAPAAARAWLRALPSGDDVLALAFEAGPFVLSIGDKGLDRAPDVAPEGMPPTIAVSGEDPRAAIHRWRPAFAPLRSRSRFTDGVSGEGVITLQAAFDGVARRTGQLFELGGGHLAPGLAIEMLRVAANANRIVVRSDGAGVVDMTLMAGRTPRLVVPVEPDGSLRPWFGPRLTSREVPAVALLQDDSELERLAGKLVLVGYTAAGGVDERVTPLAELVPGVDVHRQTLENIFDQTLLKRPAWSGTAETVAAILLALVVAFAPIRLRVGPGASLGIAIVVLPLAGGLAAYMGGLYVFDGATVAFIALIAGAPAFFAHLALAERERRQAEAVQARIDGEMEAAKRMQMGILPSAEESFPAETRFSIAATSEPARTVGGDLYDFFLLDDRRLFFLVGDVAGKGPEASLFMAISKALLKSAALRHGEDIGKVLSVANAEIARDNPAMMFVTVFAGILNVETGALEYCCAGHEPPWRISPDGRAERLEGLGGPPLCLLDDFEYPTDRADVGIGEQIVVVTDGVTEAANRRMELFGIERTAAAISALAGAPSAAEALSRLVGPVHAFADGAEPADDLTALVVFRTQA